MRRGFKEEAKRLALEVRGELGLGPLDRLDPRALAALYGIPVYTISGLAGRCDPATVAWLDGPGRPTFSAALVPCGTARIVVENDRHAETRRVSNLSHEMAHILCEHEFTKALLTADKCRAGDPDDEAEADWLGGELLITYTAALAAARAGWDDQQVAVLYGVSVPRARMRMNASGARTVVRRQAEHRARR